MEKIDETDEGYYVRNGDVLEWRWKGEEAPASPPPAEKPKRKPTRKTTRKTAKK